MNDAANTPVPTLSNANAPLPQRYEAARAAIAECERIDECKDWSDKAAAMAVYARQAKDDGLRVMAVRIQARAERRCGELLRLLEARPGARTDLGPVPALGSGASRQPQEVAPFVTRTQAATSAGMSDRQRKTALRLAALPEESFNAHVESPRPPTITQLASLGTVARGPVNDRSPWMGIESHETREACETLERFAKFCEANGPTTISRGVSASEAEIVRRLIATADQWLDGLAAELSSEW